MECGVVVGSCGITPTRCRRLPSGLRDFGNDDKYCTGEVRFSVRWFEKRGDDLIGFAREGVIGTSAGLCAFRWGAANIECLRTIFLGVGFESLYVGGNSAGMDAKGIRVRGSVCMLSSLAEGEGDIVGGSTRILLEATGESSVGCTDRRLFLEVHWGARELTTSCFKVVAVEQTVELTSCMHALSSSNCGETPWARGRRERIAVKRAFCCSCIVFKVWECVSRLGNAFD